MSILKDILEDEYNRLNRLLNEYNKELLLLPRGSISVKNIKNHDYCYLAYREGKKVKFEYIGKNSLPKVEKLNKKIKERKKIEKEIKDIKNKINEIKKVLNGKIKY